MTKVQFERQSALASCVELTSASIGKTIDIPLPPGAVVLLVGIVVDSPFDGNTPSGRLHIDGVTVLGRSFETEVRAANSPIRYFPDGVTLSVQASGTDVTTGHGICFVEYIVVGRANEVYG